MNLNKNASNEKASTRDGFGKALLKLGKNPDVVALCADLTESVRMNWFAEKYPKRFIEMGVAEQNMMGVGAGLASLGKIPFVGSFAVFSPGRNWDQLRVSVCYSNLNVKIIGGHAGITVGGDGATHEALEDIAITRCLPNMTVLVPADGPQTKKATIASAKIKGPVYIRLGREKTPSITTPKTPFKVGKADIYKDGKDIAIIACGLMVGHALQAAMILEKKGISAMVINNHTIKPIDKKTLLQAANKTGCVVTAEEHQIQGGLGSAVAEAIATNPVPLEFVGMPDSFGESGDPEKLLSKYKMQPKDIVNAALRVMKRK